MSRAVMQSVKPGSEDTSKPVIPWMDKAWTQEGIKLNPPDSFIGQVRTMQQMVHKMEQQLQSLPSLEPPSTLGEPPAKKIALTTKKEAAKLELSGVSKVVAGMEADSLAANNPEIMKYFKGLKTDPNLNKKGVSYEIAATNTTKDGWGSYINAWCAAFVNWCLKESGAPHLNYATARSWLDFGVPVSAPIYGCVTVIKPQSTTGGGTGHVAFFVRRRGRRLQLLGGNQSRQVKLSEYDEQKSLLGYRWPTTIDDYLICGGTPESKSPKVPDWAK